MPVRKSGKPARKRANRSKLPEDQKAAQNPKETGSPARSTSKNLIAGALDDSKSVIFEREGGPVKWLFPILESAYTVLSKRDGTPKAAGTIKARLLAAGDQVHTTFRSRLQPGQGENVLS